jgi:hypothetical protein
MGHHLLHQDEHLVIERVAGEPILIVRRTSSTPTPEAIRSFASTIRHALAGIDRSRHAMLVDLHAAPLRGGEDIDKALTVFRVEATRDVFAVARIVVTSVGALQIQRLGGDDGRPTQSFSNEDEALAWLRTQMPNARRQRAR